MTDLFSRAQIHTSIVSSLKLSKIKLKLHENKHSNRMRTTRLLTVGGGGPGVCLQGVCVQEGGVSRGCVHTPLGPKAIFTKD